MTDGKINRECQDGCPDGHYNNTTRAIALGPPEPDEKTGKEDDDILSEYPRADCYQPMRSRKLVEAKNPCPIEHNSTPVYVVSRPSASMNRVYDRPNDRRVPILSKRTGKPAVLLHAALLHAVLLQILRSSHRQ